MKINQHKILISIVGISLCTLTACKIPLISEKTATNTLPVNYGINQDSTNAELPNWKTYFSDPILIALIDTALSNNQEISIINQELAISKNEIRAKKGEYLPFLNLKAGIGYEKTAKYTRNGAVEEALPIKEGKAFPTILGDYFVGGLASWELDVWNKLHNATKAASIRYLSTQEGKHFAITTIVSEIASSYFELVILDNQLEIIEQSASIQADALRIIKQQKEAAKVTQLAVNRFEAQLLNTQNRQFEVKQHILELENKIRFLTGSYLPTVKRNSSALQQLLDQNMPAGIPVQVLERRPDIRAAILDMQAAKLDVQAAKANFYPSFRIQAGLGFQSFNPVYLVNPASILYNMAGDMVAPLINKNAITATYLNTKAKQIQTVFIFQQKLLQAYTEVLNQLGKNSNYEKSYAMKLKEVELLLQSTTISSNLFNAARADYVEVLLTQREALESKIQLTEILMNRISAKVKLYQSLGGGWN